jgi:large subunit ribosomal protein L31e
MAEETERILTVPLNRTKGAPRTKRAPRAVKEIREFVARHMKAAETMSEDEKENMVSPHEKIWIDPKVNCALWARGIEKPPASIRVKVIKFEDGQIEVSLPEE